MYGYILFSKKPMWVGNYIYIKEHAESIAKQMNEDHKKIGIKQKIEIKPVEITFPF